LRCLGLLEVDHLKFLDGTGRILEWWEKKSVKGDIFHDYPPALVRPTNYFHLLRLICCEDFSFEILIGWPDWSVIRFAELICGVELARTGIAVERYRNAKGGLPEALSDLVPKILPAVPLDSWDGKPVRYKKLSKGYVIYSVGKDGKGDGGTAETEERFDGTTFRVAR